MIRSLIRLALLPALLLVTTGCQFPGGKTSDSDLYDATRDQVFDAMRDAFDASYDLDKVDRDRGRVTTHWDYSNAAAVFSQDGYRARGEGKLVEGKRADGSKGYKAEVKVYVETNVDKDQPLNPHSATANWRRDGTNPVLAQRILRYMDTLLLDYGPSDIWKRENEGRP